MNLALRAAVVGLLLVLPGCTAEDQPSPSAPSASPHRHTERPKVAPKTTRELDLSKYQDKPCDLLSEDQLSALRFPRHGERWGRGVCKWHAPDADLGFVGYPDSNSLQDTYNVLQGVTYDVFRPTTVAGQPAVVYAGSPGARVCNVSVGIAHDQGINITVSGSRPGVDWCTMSVGVATDIVHNLGG